MTKKYNSIDEQLKDIAQHIEENFFFGTDRQEERIPNGFCDRCQYFGTDGGGPGEVMLCKHPSLSGSYEDSVIIYWEYNPLRRVSDTCPLVTENDSCKG